MPGAFFRLVAPGKEEDMMPEQQWTHETDDRREHVHVTREGNVERRETVVEDRAAERHLFLTRLSQVFWLLFGILQGLIALRIVLKFIAANPNSPFAAMIYSITDLFLWPFFGLTITPEAGGMVLEIPSIIAMLVYSLLAWVVMRVIWLLFYQPGTRSVSTYEREDRIR
jgi:hypothetical protein